MCPWVYTTVPSGSPFQPRIRSWLRPAMIWLPVSTSSSPSSVENALTLPNEAENAVRGATSASPTSWVTGWCPSVEALPVERRSASSRRSFTQHVVPLGERQPAFAALAGLAPLPEVGHRRQHRVERQRPGHDLDRPRRHRQRPLLHHLD